MSRKPKRISLEQLETRQLLSVGARVQLFPMGTTAPAPVLRSALSTAAPVKLNPLGTSSGPVECIPLDIVVPGSGNANSPVGLTPAQIRKAYGVDSIDLNGVVGDGKGQTVAIVDAYDNPTLDSDLAVFSATFHLPQMDGVGTDPTFKKVNQYGDSSPLPLPDVRGGWGTEEALDVEWVHAIAPKANIVLVEAKSADTNDVIQIAVPTAASLAPVVSMSFGTFGEFAGETTLDSYFTHPGVTYLASSGDFGAFFGGYPAYSPNVIAVGGTTLHLGASNVWAGEKGWSLGSDSWNTSLASGGGLSIYESAPTYQNGLGLSARGMPDVSFDADPNTGVAIYDTYDSPAIGGPWAQFGGTSLAAPCWAGLVSIVNQGRALAGNGTVDSGQLHSQLYGIYNTPSQYSHDFHKQVVGNNGYPCTPGYDLVTGIGSPRADSLVYDLSGLTKK